MKEMNEYSLTESLEKALDALENWVEAHQYRAYEPFDGLSSFLHPIVRGNMLLERLLQQAVRQSPINLRPVLGIKPRASTKGRGFMAWGYMDRYKHSGIEDYKNKALNCLQWLAENKSPLYNKHSWGNAFPFTSRCGTIGVDEPIIVWTSLIGQVFLEAYDLFGMSEHLEIIESIRQWIVELPLEKTRNGSCLSYVAFEQRSIHNSNMLGAAFLAGAARHTGDAHSLVVAREAMLYSCSRQLPDGAWFYGEQPDNRWIDNFHTAYNLDSLKRYIDATSDKEFEENLRRGFNYYRRTFFEADGTPRYYHNRTYPIDIQCAAQSIDTLTQFSDQFPECIGLACAVAWWTIKNMQDRDGHFHYRLYPGGIRAKTPMMHWGQATTYKALARLLMKIGKKISIANWGRSVWTNLPRPAVIRD